MYIGKKSNELKETEIMGVQDDEYTVYVDDGGSTFGLTT